MQHLLFLAFALNIGSPKDGQPYRQPQLAVDRNQVAVAFVRGNTIQVAVSNDGGREFGHPLDVATVPVLAVGRHRGPRVLISGQNMLVTAVTGDQPATGPHAHGLPQDGNLVSWQSHDGGHSWSAPQTVNDVPGSAREGLQNIASGGGEEVAAVWLDLRSNGTKIYGSYSHDFGHSWSKNILLAESPDGTLCQCCHPSVVSTGRGTYDVMFRNAVAGARDMYLAHWNIAGKVTGGSKLGEGSWKLDACPMDGGALARSKGATVTAWRRDHSIYLDRLGAAETDLGQGKDVSLAASADGPAAIWATSSGIVLLRSQAKESESLSNSGAFPVIVSVPDRAFVAAWEQDGTIRVQRVDARVLTSARRP
jgi:hypothetical protein